MKYALFFAAIAAFAQRPQPIPIGRDPVELDKFRAAHSSADYRARTTLPAAPEVNAYLSELGHRLGPAHYTFELVDDEQTTLNHEPACFPGGAIFVSAKLIATVRDQGELAAMLAHAVGHVQHPVVIDGKEQMFSIPVTLIAGTTGFAPTDAYVAPPLSFLPRLRAAELQADRAAVTLLAQAGIDPSALYRYLDRTLLTDGPTTGYFAGKSPLPPKTERLQALQEAIAQLPQATYEAHPVPASIQETVTQLLKRPDRPRPTLRRLPEAERPSLRK